MFDLQKLMEKYWGGLRFYAAMGKKPFAEITIEDKLITIRIVSFPVLVEAIVSHIFRKHRFGSFKLHTLKDSGYRLRIKFGRLSFDI